MKLLIVDDEAPARERLRRLLEETGSPYEVAGEAANGMQALELCRRLEIDLVLLDIRMPGTDGLEVAARLASEKSPPAVIFTTAFDEHAVEAFAHSAVGYLLKPIRAERLRDALQRAQVLTRPQLHTIEALQADAGVKRQHICAMYRGDLQAIAVEEIRFFRAEQKYVAARHSHGEALLEEPLKSLERDFAEQFLRIHRNALVAKSYIVALEKDRDGRYRLRLRDVPEKLEVSRRHLSQVRKWLKGLAS